MSVTNLLVVTLRSEGHLDDLGLVHLTANLDVNSSIELAEGSLNISHGNSLLQARAEGSRGDLTNLATSGRIMDSGVLCIE
jgi:hypothetical protein